MNMLIMARIEEVTRDELLETGVTVDISPGRNFDGNNL